MNFVLEHDSCFVQSDNAWTYSKNLTLTVLVTTIDALQYFETG